MFLRSRTDFFGTDEAAQHLGRSRLREDDSDQDQGATAPTEKAEPVVGEEVAEEARPHSLEREDEGDPVALMRRCAQTWIR
jgi:hypothetical protein